MKPLAAALKRQPRGAVASPSCVVAVGSAAGMVSTVVVDRDGRAGRPAVGDPEVVVGGLVGQDLADEDRVAGAVGHAVDARDLAGAVVEEAAERPAVPVAGPVVRAPVAVVADPGLARRRAGGVGRLPGEDAAGREAAAA